MGGVPKTVALWLSFALFPLDRFQIVFILRYKPAKIPFINQSITTYLIYVVEASTHLLTGDSLSASSSPLNSSARNLLRLQPVTVYTVHVVVLVEVVVVVVMIWDAI